MTDESFHCFGEVPRTRRAALAGVCALVACALAGRPARAAADAPDAVTIAYQPGVGYMPFVVLQKQGLLAKAFPNTKFDWRELASGSAIRDGVISNSIQIGAPGTSPFLIGWDKGVPWKILCAANFLDHWLVAMDPAYKTLRDFKPGDKIGMPAPDSIQSVVLRKALQDDGLDPHLLDSGFLAMAHPVAEAALLNKQIAGHMGAPPFSQDEVKKGGHVVLRESDAFPAGICSTVVAVNTQFAAQYPQFVAGFYKAYQGAVGFILAHQDEATAMYVDYTGGKANAAEVSDVLKTSGARMFALAPKGVLKAAAFMKQVGLIDKAPASYADIALPSGAPGQ